MAQPENIGAQPYHAQITPQGLGEDLRRYLQDEFQQIQFALSGFPAAAAYGAVILEQPGTAPDQPLDPTPVLIVGWDKIEPDRPNRTLPDVTTDFGITVSEAGVYQVHAQLEFDLDQGRQYTFRIFVNGLDSGIASTVDPSQQTDVATIILVGLLTMQPGDLVQMFGEAEALGAPHLFIIRQGGMFVSRISEFQHDDG